MITSHRPSVSTLRPRVDSLRLALSDLGLAPLKLQLALSHKIELTPSYLRLTSSQKVD